jgi:hypothetical protein
MLPEGDVAGGFGDAFFAGMFCSPVVYAADGFFFREADNYQIVIFSSPCKPCCGAG